MSYKKLARVLAGILAVTVAAGCSSAPTRGAAGVAPEVLRQQIVQQHEAEAQRRRQDLINSQEAGVQTALAGLTKSEQEEIKGLEEQFKFECQVAQETARAELEGEELDAKLRELQEEYDAKLIEETEQVKARSGSAERDRIRMDMDLRFAQARDDLDAQLRMELEEKLRKFDIEQQAKMETQRRTRQEAQRRAQQEAQRRAEEEARARRVAEGGAAPFAETKAPIEPVEIRPEVPVEGKGLRMEEDLPLGQRRHYVHKYFRRGEAFEKIRRSTDLKNIERHELVVTFWMEGGAGYAVPRFHLNGQPVYSWEELENGVALFRQQLIREHHILYPKVVLDQRKDVPLQVVDDILGICFRVGIRDIAMSSREPLVEQ